MEIQALVARAPNEPFSLETVEITGPKSDEILVRVHGVGICHTDVAARDQHLPTALPAILGHEGSGIVVSIGEAVSKVKPGDRVVMTFRSCGECDRCQAGEPAYCLRWGSLNAAGARPCGDYAIHAHGTAINGNFFGQSSFAEYALAYERNVVRVPDGVPLELMGPLGCGVQTGAGAVMRSLACGAGASVLVAGGGAVGLSAVMGAVICGCSTIVVSEPHSYRRGMALELGATHVIDPSSDDWCAALRRILPAGVDYALDTSGRPEVMAGLLNCLGSRGTLGLVGVPPAMTDTLALPILGVMAFGQSVRGIVEGDSDPDIFIPHLIELYQAGRFPFDRLVKCYGLGEINKAIADQESGESIKAVLVPAP